jgi:hypothetical protein
VWVGASDVGIAFKGSKSIGAGLPKSTSNSVLSILGIKANGLTLQAPKKSTSDTTGIFALDGAGMVFKNVSPGKGPIATGDAA